MFLNVLLQEPRMANLQLCIILFCVEYFNPTTEMVITSAPEGSRSRVHKWKTGFYYIATGANVPIAFGVP